MRKTIHRTREMSRLSCRVVVFRNECCNTFLGIIEVSLMIIIFYLGMTCDSTDLVPGDIVNLSASQLSMVPADIFLLSGDAIINESMLTGESVPVSKAAAKDEEILKWRDERSENPKTFLYGGTRVVRIRGIMSSVGQERPALGFVARTGKLNSSGFSA